MDSVLQWLKENRPRFVEQLAALVAIQSVSTRKAGAHSTEVQKAQSVQDEQQIRRSAELTVSLMREAGLDARVLDLGGESRPYAYGEWLGAPAKPTVFLYAHHDVQPADVNGWNQADPWTLVRKEGRLYGRGAADDKGAIVAQLAGIAAFLKTGQNLPVNVKMLVDGEEEDASKGLPVFFQQYGDRIQSDVIVVCDTLNIATGLPCITYSLRGLVELLIQVEGATRPSHSGIAGGVLADPAIALSVLLSRLCWDGRSIPAIHSDPHIKELSASESEMIRSLPGDEPGWRREFGIFPDVRFATEPGRHPYEQAWRRPAVTVIIQEAGSFATKSNQVLPKASAVVSCRIVPEQEPRDVQHRLEELLTTDPPWGVKVSIQHTQAVRWWMTDPAGSAFQAAMEALRSGYDAEPKAIGCGATIGFVGPLAELFGGAPQLLLGIEDPLSQPHAPNESLPEDDWYKLMTSLAHLFVNLSRLKSL